jgi:hypothetical protein
MLPQVHEGYPQEFLSQLFRLKLHNLESLVLPMCGDMDEAGIDGIQEIVAKNYPKLQHLSVIYDWKTWGGVGPFELTNGFLRGCVTSGRGLRSFHAEAFYDTFTTPGSDPVSVLIQHHASTLEELVLLCKAIRSASIQSILTTCNNLRILRVGPNEEYTSIGSFSFGDAGLSEWVCRHITVLQLCLDRRVNVPEGARAEDVISQAVQRVYAQIGRLVQLEELSLRYDTNKFYTKIIDAFTTAFLTTDLTLEHGWLAELAGLKNLKHFRMETDFWTSMDRPEVEFMDANWPRLRSIGFADCYWGAVVESPHWQWLKQVRPRLAYVSEVV